jgi:peptidyl-prolyl cis-trans isomerase A (cyclophilin A)
MVLTVPFILFNLSSHGQPSSAPKESSQKTEGKDKRKVKKMFAVFEITYGGKPMGKIKAKLYDKFAPETVANFVGLAEGTKQFFLDDPEKPGQRKSFQKPFYDGLTFHRVIAGFMIQGGDPVGDGTGGPGYKIKDEFSKYAKHDKPGILSMANAGADTGGSQFFITVSEQNRLDGKHAVFGEVVEGYDIVEQISKVPVEPGTSKPLKPVVMKKVTILREY